MIDCLDEGVIYIFDCVDKGYMIAKVLSKIVNSFMPYLIVEEPCRLMFKDANNPSSELIQLSTWVPYMLSPSKTIPLAMSCIQSVVIPDDVTITKYISILEIMTKDRLYLLNKGIMERRAKAAKIMCDSIFKSMDNMNLKEH
jgi:hypothetical protein